MNVRWASVAKLSEASARHYNQTVITLLNERRFMDLRFLDS